MLVCTHVITLSLRYECVFCSFMDISSGGRFETTEGVTIQISACPSWLRGIMIFANICSGEQGNSETISKYFYKHDSHALSLLIHYRADRKSHFNSSSNMRKLIKILQNLQSSKFNFCLSFENFCFENNSLYSNWTFSFTFT